MKKFTLHQAPQQRGVALIEAMVALLIMAFGMVALAGLQSEMRRSADLAKQRGEAIRPAQQEMEQLRDYSLLNPPATPASGVQDYTSIADRTNANAGDPGSNATFALTRDVTDLVDPPVKAVNVTVSWRDRANGAQFVIIDSYINGADPSLSGSLGVKPDSTPLRRPAERDASIPVGAKDLGNKLSVFVPSPNATVAWVFNNLTGVIVGSCTVAMGTQASSLTAASVASCSNNTLGFMLSGFVRFSFASTPDAVQPASDALPQFDFEIVQADPLPIPASGPTPTVPGPPTHRCFDDAPADSLSRQPFVSYYCVVFPSSETVPKWSGKLNITGIPLGSGERKICRYSADYNRDSSIGNVEHPLNYHFVTGPLTRQNFLVINASANCPDGVEPDKDQRIFSNTRTVLHQPGCI